MSAFDKKAKQAEKDKARREQEATAKRAKKEAEKQKKLEAQKEAQKKKSAEGALKKAAKLTPEQIAAAEAEAALVAATMERMRVKEEEAASARAAAQRTMAAITGTPELFKPKMSKEEKKLEAERKKRERESKKRIEEGANEEDEAELEAEAAAGAAGKAKAKKKGGKKTALEIAQAEAAEVEAELEDARVKAATSRREMGAYLGHLEAKSFNLPNPGGGQPLLEDASCILVRGKAYGLIGRNGKGKSTMLRALAARRVGEVPPNVCVHYVSQEVHLSEKTKVMTPAQCVVEADVERRILLEEKATLDALADSGELDGPGQQQLAEVMEKLDLIGADTAERRADELIEALGFSEELRSRQLQDLSGGWRVRTMLAAAIFARPDLMLLDEPTNHLSITAVMWLARELSTNPIWKERIIVIVSHDRAFLDEVCTDCLHISGAARQLTQSRGNYTTWKKRRDEMKVLYEKEKALREKEIETLDEFAGHGFRYGGSSSAINKMKMKALQAEKLREEAKEHAEGAAALQEDHELPLLLKAGGEVQGNIVEMHEVAFSYPGQELLFEDCEFGITSKSRVVLLGENGNGKTTLVKLMLGQLEPTKGHIFLSGKCRVALVNQHHADQIDLDKTPLEYMMNMFAAPSGVSAYEHLQRIRSHLANCGVTSGAKVGEGQEAVLEMQNTPAGALSGGQRSRVAMAAVSFKEPHLLVLDEPTNNLDLESVAALADSVSKFEGAVVCVSHDQYFVNRIANEAWVVGGPKKKVVRVESFEAYRADQLRKLNIKMAEAEARNGR
jgi:ATP-binding cassette subfamily F protein 3